MAEALATALADTLEEVEAETDGNVEARYWSTSWLTRKGEFGTETLGFTIDDL